MADFLLELLSEEIPARMQAKAQADLARLFEEHLAAAGLKAEAIETYATPRRLALIARSLPAETEAVSEELKGPRTSAPPQALEGFLRKTGLTQEQLTERDGAYFAVIEKPGRATASVLAEAIPAIVRAFPWPKSMRWGVDSASTESLRWVRPLQGIVALLGEDIVAFEIAGIKSGAATVGHRFHHPGCITLGGAHDYVEKLRACHVIVDPAERRRIIADGAHKAAADAGLTLIEDDGLLAENAGLTEWPVPLPGAFDPAFLEVPREVIQLTLRTNQKYFVLTGADGALAPNFLCVANIDASDGGAGIIEGNRKVLAARLSDARFFWEQDVEVPLAEQWKKLSQIVFHEKLGTVADKVERVAKLARWLVEEGIVGRTLSPGGRGQGEGVRPSGVPADSEPPHPNPLPVGEREKLADLAERAARLAKADLVTGLVGEFPELQGIIGGHLARAQGEPDEVADAIRDHYKPVGQGDEVPTAPVTVAVSLADKLDTLVGFFHIDEKPTGSKDPFALRRAAVSAIALILESNSRVLLRDVLAFARNSYREQGVGGVEVEPHGDTVRAVAKAAYETVFMSSVFDFMIERLAVQQRDRGIRHDIIGSVFALARAGNVDLVSILARVKALQSFVETPEGADLLAGYKRAANILKKEGWPPSVTPAQAGVQSDEGLDSGLRRNDEAEQVRNKELSYTPENEETALIAALDSAEPRAAAAVEAEDFEGAMAALASLRAPVDAFFDKVTVNDPDPAKRTARLNLLLRIRDAVHQVADFSRIEG
ncbi:glycine--tRNA ligase subunit beta [Sphingosinicella sp. LHD-64]|uniref:glycine--tRNA ligase subunit beta n=1 Tax=Sphingosinicella sp. LHD-64 TaxID=3072139 RepID=UPI00280E8F72|nr:glycine--tRNA ligase subunit beta [Sphingosinicella sp. LHD-64]MDQ8755399.1 glycine--tRNA ligase subunit beta [Sphingosinicella sp. LHD-64]